MVAYSSMCTLAVPVAVRREMGPVCVGGGTIEPHAPLADAPCAQITICHARKYTRAPVLAQAAVFGMRRCTCVGTVTAAVDKVLYELGRRDARGKENCSPYDLVAFNDIAQEIVGCFLPWGTPWAQIPSDPVRVKGFNVVAPIHLSSSTALPPPRARLFFDERDYVSAVAKFVWHELRVAAPEEDPCVFFQAGV